MECLIVVFILWLLFQPSTPRGGGYTPMGPANPTPPPRT